ncbi:hypothetical protein AQ610_12250 [Burkholderia humptydooensis]|nr:hypothetical protein AQ610_12250 [Burkholderia humptydooensis]
MPILGTRDQHAGGRVQPVAKRLDRFRHRMLDIRIEQREFAEPLEQRGGRWQQGGVGRRSAQAARDGQDVDGVRRGAGGIAS